VSFGPIAFQCHLGLTFHRGSSFQFGYPNSYCLFFFLTSGTFLNYISLARPTDNFYTSRTFLNLVFFGYCVFLQVGPFKNYISLATDNFDTSRTFINLVFFSYCVFYKWDLLKIIRLCFLQVGPFKNYISLATDNFDTSRTFINLVFFSYCVFYKWNLLKIIFHWLLTILIQAEPP